MASKTNVGELEVQIREIIHQLLELAITPHVRELRAKAVTYGRVIGSWGLYPPTQPQFDAMTEVVADLAQKVKDAKRDAIREAGRSPSSRAMQRVLTPPPPPPVTTRRPPELDSFEAALRDEIDSTGVRPRAVRPPPMAPGGRRSSAPPHEPSVPRHEPARARAKPQAVAAGSRKRPASDTKPPPAPALLHTRRSR